MELLSHYLAFLVGMLLGAYLTYDTMQAKIIKILTGLLEEKKEEKCQR